MELEIEVFFHSDETLKLEKNDVGYSVLRCDTRVMTFYTIEAIAPYVDEESDEVFCKIFVTNTFFIATKSYEEIKKIIHDHLKLKS